MVAIISLVWAIITGFVAWEYWLYMGRYWTRENDEAQLEVVICIELGVLLFVLTLMSLHYFLIACKLRDYAELNQVMLRQESDTDPTTGVFEGTDRRGESDINAGADSGYTQGMGGPTAEQAMDLSSQDGSTTGDLKTVPLRKVPKPAATTTTTII